MIPPKSNSAAGNPGAERYLPEVYAHLRRVAASQFRRLAPGQTLQATALVHEAWLHVSKQPDSAWECRAHFFGAAARSMREILLKRARRKSRVKHGDGWSRVEFSENSIGDLGGLAPEEYLTLDEALRELESRDALQAQVVELRFFAGQTHRDIADMLGLSERQVERVWRFARAYLQRRVGSNRVDD